MDDTASDLDFGEDPLADAPPADIDIDLRVDSGVRHLSPSSAGMYEQCARKWKHRYLDRLPDPPGEAALVGTFAHRVLELLLQDAPDRRTLDRAKELAREAWPETETDPDYQVLELSDTDARRFRWKGWSAIEGLWRLENPAVVDVAATEQKVDVELNGVPFRGIVDRVDNEPDGVVITDYKSGRAPRPRYQKGRLTQVLLYAGAVGELNGAPPTRARLLYLGQRVIETAVTPDNLGEALEGLKTTWTNIESDCASQTFAPTTGPLCAWCPFVAQCPEGMAEVSNRYNAGQVRLDAPAVAHLADAS
ncbi:MAG: PD-(D/E)XK nuclease family protein [Acidimicrobiales bacterium]|nr:PD-(D/E)XK nuclease family protein [Acidimicrobiales bacterium]